MFLFSPLLLAATLISRLVDPAGAAAIHERDFHKHNAAIVKRNLEARSKEEVLLRPIDIDYLHHSLNRRSDVPKLDNYSRLDPSMRELLMYGAPFAQDGGLFVANMTVNAPKGKKLLLMEKFNGFTKEVDCTTAGDGKLSVTLKERKTYDYVYRIWGWLNENDKNEFVMITNHKGCGPENERTVYRVYQVDFDDEEMRVSFYSEEKEWATSIGSYSVDFGNLQVDSGESRHGLQTRDLFVRNPWDIGKTFSDFGKNTKKTFDDAGKDVNNVADKAGNAIVDAKDKAVDAFKDFGSWLKTLPKNVADQIDKLDDKLKAKLLEGAKKLKGLGKDFVTVFNKAKDKLGDKFEEVAKQISEMGDGSLGKDNVDFNLASGKSGVKKNLYTDPFHKDDPNDIIDCVDCYVTGKIVLSGHVQFEDFLPKSAFFEAKPVDLTTMMKFRIFTRKSKDLNGDGKVDTGLKVQVDIFSATLPLVMIPGIFLLGPKFEFEVGLNSLIRSDVDFTFGFKGQAPNSAVYRKDLLDKNKHESSKWEGAKVEGLPFELLAGSLEAEFQASTNLVLAIGIQLAGIFGYEAGFKLKLPRLKRTYTTITKEDDTQACPGSKHETLANSTTGILEKNEINLDLIAMVGQDKTINAKALETTLFNIKIPFQDQCHPIVDKRTAENKALAKWNNQQQGIPSATFGTQTDAGVVKASGAPTPKEIGISSVPTGGPIATIGATNKDNPAAPTTSTTASNPATPTTPPTATGQTPVTPTGPAAAPPIDSATGLPPPSTFPGTGTVQPEMAPPSTFPGTVTPQNPADPANAGQTQPGQTVPGQTQDLLPLANDPTIGQPVTNTPPADPVANPSAQQYPAVAADPNSQQQYPPTSLPPASVGTNPNIQQQQQQYPPTSSFPSSAGTGSYAQQYPPVYPQAQSIAQPQAPPVAPQYAPQPQAPAYPAPAAPAAFGGYPGSFF
ncbi:hypothetical protein L873DRAFT_1794663 [Choiromyces venosus 120613-1]|uniref:Uncharacterized protein n=1 Tax=Choiromyces venosus 120613-1 TaxID=1336337 RepID=A0A3N4JDE5_9PEZI|nr:hypothetical protein L873DRAFT_1794663 [Choiromyces venosus 120613-1]